MCTRETDLGYTQYIVEDLVDIHVDCGYLLIENYYNQKEQESSSLFFIERLSSLWRCRCTKEISISVARKKFLCREAVDCISTVGRWSPLSAVLLYA